MLGKTIIKNENAKTSTNKCISMKYKKLNSMRINTKIKSNAIIKKGIETSDFFKVTFIANKKKTKAIRKRT